MVAFQVLVNGKPLYTIGAGEFGILGATVQWNRIQSKAGPIHQKAIVRGTALHASDKTHSHWPDETLQVGDEITVRIIETDNCDPPATRMSLDELQQRCK